MKIMKYFYLTLIAITCLFIVGCKKDKHTCKAGEWIYPETYFCEEEVTLKKYCVECDKLMATKKEIIEEHHDLQINEVPATCTVAGDRVITCEKCPYEKHEIIEAAHKIVMSTVNPTCTQDGYDEYVCTECDYAYNETIKAPGHKLIITDIEPGCAKKGMHQEKCENCDYNIKEYSDPLGHILVETVVDPTCTEDGYYGEECTRCDYTLTNKIAATGHQNVDTVIDRVATDELYGIKHRECKDCFETIETIEYANNGFSRHGKLSVNGTDLVNKDGEPVQLIGLSTHGLQWAGKYVRFDTFEAIKNSFGINVIRLSLYTDEDGYVTGGEKQKEKLYQLVVKGIEYATELDMYVIVDWHMLGPNLYEEEAIECFTRLTKQFPDNENILFEIMNEPYSNSEKTIEWAECKAYAERIIPIIRQNNDGIILIGSPHYTTDLDEIMDDPIIGIDNIMYSYHFYAAAHKSTATVVRAYAAGLPVFITEHGGMEATGDGDVDFTSIANWYKDLNMRNISYVAWNISNTAGSASIIKYGNQTFTVFDKDTLKTWGFYYRGRVRERFGLPY